MIRHGAKLLHAFAERDRAALHRRAAQGVRRRLHHDELQGPGREPGPRLDARRARHHGRRSRRSASCTAARSPPPPIRPPSGAGSPTTTPRGTSRRARRPPAAPSTRSSCPTETRARLAWALSTIRPCPEPRPRPGTSRCERALLIRTQQWAPGDLRTTRTRSARGSARSPRRLAPRPPQAIVTHDIHTTPARSGLLDRRVRIHGGDGPLDVPAPLYVVRRPLRLGLSRRRADLRGLRVRRHHVAVPRRPPIQTATVADESSSRACADRCKARSPRLAPDSPRC